MQANLTRGKPAFSIPNIGRSVAVLVGAPLIVTIAFCAPALAACGVSHPAGVHAASTGVSGVHASTSRTAATSTGSGGSGTLGCPSGSSATALRGLPVAGSGRVIETSSHTAHAATTSRNAATKLSNASPHLRGVKSPHHA
jgi:hypothetical protein